MLFKSFSCGLKKMLSLCRMITIFLFLLSVCGCCHGQIYTFTMYHRYSEPVKKWCHSATETLEKGNCEYYAELADRDRTRLSFSGGNSSTFRINSLGFLHYATVQLGTPGVKFMVALDTGSDLFWVPCDCVRCASLDSTAYGSDFDLSTYSPSRSSTSKKVTCNSSLCMNHNQCHGAFSNCSYMVSYASAETSTSGILVEDVLHFTDGDNHHIEANVMFGCGQVQSGSFLDVAAPNGLFGLGMENISVPSMLSRQGFTADSFSMCFGRSGVGRISFGDKGSLDQDETPFNLNPSHPTYNITVTQVRVGTSLIDLEFTALFDSGTSFTLLVDPTYTNISESFHSQVQDRRHPFDSRIPFEYCYDMSPNANTSLLPSMSLVMGGGSHFAVFDPIKIISNQRVHVYCLAIVKMKSAELNIIGQNFMTGYHVVFDREKLILGWKQSNCYDDIEDHNAVSIGPHSNNVPPTFTTGLGNYPETRKTKYNSQRSTASPSSHCSFRFVLFCFVYMFGGHLFVYTGG
ncbi:aspartyl protease family protein 1-like [Lotus japonicus]|uniref:aspartyl protease family protein 1-like n=1 Tax=Lotus japonicus TaxID=34305 RepID=UPI00258DC267|nr:aspartyl protease family protein 1-like [Lotus japonicus]